MSSQGLTPSPGLANHGEQGQSKNLETYFIWVMNCAAGMLAHCGGGCWHHRWCGHYNTSSKQGPQPGPLSFLQPRPQDSHTLLLPAPLPFLTKPHAVVLHAPHCPMEWYGLYWIFNNKTPLSSFVRNSGPAFHPEEAPSPSLLDHSQWDFS